MLEVTAIPALSTNYVWLIHGATDRSRVAVVDPGEAAPVISALEADDLTPVCVLITHKHPDHVGGIPELLERYPDLVVWGPEHHAIPSLDRIVSEGMAVEPEGLGLSFQVMEIPGHTLEHVAYLGHGCVFAGDTLFSIGCGRIFEGSAEQMLDSLDRLATLPEDTLLYCGHEYTVDNLRFARSVLPEDTGLGEAAQAAAQARAEGRPTVPTNIGHEQRLNPFLRTHEGPVEEACASRAGKTLADRAEVLAELRRWKDGFS